MMISHIPSVLCGLGLTLAGPPAFAQKINIEYDHDADFSRVKTYEWRTHPIFEKNSDLKETYSVSIQLVLGAGNEQLAKKGLRPADSSPDVFVTFFVVARPNQREVTTFVDPGPSWWVTPYGWYAPPVWTSTQIENYLDGMLVMDIVDAKTSKLLWRAYCGDEVKDWNNRHKIVEKVVRKALDRYPPKSK
jgi:hypothetical protein